MKKSVLVVLAAGLVGFTSCEKKQAVEATDAVEVTNQPSENATVFAVNTEKSNVEWRAFKFYESENKEAGHNGFFKFKSGEVGVENGALTSGTFTIDVASLESLDLNDDPDSKAKLDGHLKSEDFLHVEKYPEATFVITSVKPIEGEYNTEISGNLKLREIEKNITVKANVSVEGNQLQLNSEEFSINRKDFGVNFEGKQGVVIRDNVSLKVNVVAETK
ncbi:YceI family protein [Ornithobacterium rhinotracheale]|uniref:YceI family protein n=1 Tax=Ornithobacterium rhinotracheale TaxID=28251 RepID=UPI00129CA9C6|nr:YceI family protein [Ornithobacterium rhinotracheale]MRI64365.1 YceI family protein [Ornithobacterium rhinotracheale]MRJ08087.1 YceI family protein [Ornithobacterium rhinotracheale]UOH78405.1 YceI family protein [Ornithobacterium rhinotracheale]